MALTVKKLKPQNPELIPGVQKVSRSQMYHKRGLWAIQKWWKFPTHDKAPAIHFHGLPPSAFLSSSAFKQVWERADEFVPKRFDLDGPVPNETNTNYRFIPFSGGLAVVL